MIFDQLTATTTGQSIDALSTKITGQNVICRGITLQAAAANGAAVYVGNSDVSSTTGYELVAGATLTINSSSSDLRVDTIFLRAASTTQKVNIAVQES